MKLPIFALCVRRGGGVAAAAARRGAAARRRRRRKKKTAEDIFRGQIIHYEKNKRKSRSGKRNVRAHGHSLNDRACSNHSIKLDCGNKILISGGVDVIQIK